MKKTCPNDEQKGGKVDQAMMENTCRYPSLLESPWTHKGRGEYEWTCDQWMSE